LAVASATYEIVDGVRRAKAAQMSGLEAIPARIDDGTGALGPVLELQITSLRSPKDDIDISTTAKFQRFKNTFDKTRRGSLPPPIIVVRGGGGRLISDVGFNF
jgi:hypothetical protein